MGSALRICPFCHSAVVSEVNRVAPSVTWHCGNCDKTWSEVPRSSRHLDQPSARPTAERLETLWRLRSTTGRVWECVAYRVSNVEELRLQPHGGDDAPVRTRLVHGDRDAISEDWRTAMIAKGFKPA
jgi:hypothetical protein